MKTFNDFTIYCTPEQTRRAIELGVPIKYKEVTDFEGHLLDYEIIEIPTTEQICGWLRKEKNIFFTPKKVGDNNYVLIGDLKHFQTYDSYEEAILVGIDISLVCLINKKGLNE